MIRVNPFTVYGYSPNAQQQYAYQYELDQRRKIDESDRKFTDFLVSTKDIDDSHRRILCQRILQDIIAWEGIAVAQNVLG